MALVPSMLPGANLPVNECSSCACIREAAAMELPGGFGRARGALLPWPDRQVHQSVLSAASMHEAASMQLPGARTALCFNICCLHRCDDAAPVRWC